MWRLQAARGCLCRMCGGHKFGHRSRRTIAAPPQSICVIILFRSARNHFSLFHSYFDFDSSFFVYVYCICINIYICFIRVACSAWYPFLLSVLLLRLWPLHTFAIFILLAGIRWAMKYEWFFELRAQQRSSGGWMLNGESVCEDVFILNHRIPYTQINEYIETWSMKINNIQLPGNQTVAKISINCYPW